MGPSEVHPFASLEEMGDRIVSLAARTEPSFIYAYWPLVDALSHLHGWRSEETGGHLREVDRLIDACVGKLAGTGTTLLVSADHGFVDTRPDTRLALADFPQLESMLTHPLCGEPRLVYCYVKPGAEDEFEDAVAQQMASAAKVRPIRSCATESVPMH